MDKRALHWLVVMAGGGAIASMFVVGAMGLNARTPGSAGLGPIGYVAWYCTGAFAFWRRPDNLVARRLLLAGTSFIVAGALGYDLFQVFIRYGPLPWLWVANAFQQLVEWGAYAWWVALLAVYPDSSNRHPWEDRIVWALVATSVAVPVLLLLSYPGIQVDPWFAWSLPTSSPLYVSALAGLSPVTGALWWARFPVVMLGVVLLVLRGRRYHGLQRRQIQWALVATVLYVVLNFLPVNQAARLLGMKPSVVGELPWEIAFALTPLALVVAVFKYRLLDITLVIRKSIVYGVLWLAILLAYVGAAAILGIAAGHRVPVGLAVLLTIGVTLVFGPARRWLERVADRWVFGERLDGYTFLRQFGATLEDTFDLDQLASRVASAIQEGLGLSWVRISLYIEDMQPQVPLSEVNGHALRLSATIPVGAAGIELYEAKTPVEVASLLNGAESIGRIECGPKIEGNFEQRDRDLLETLGRQAALAIHNSRLAAQLAGRLEEIRVQADELAASRTRIVQAQDAERRRIERNIHDGVQQNIVALLTKIRLARNQLGRDTLAADGTLEEIQDDARLTLEDLRELAQGIHPPVLSDRGLLEAIEARAARLPLGVNIESDLALRDMRFAHEIEGAAYFLISEGLANILKHAAARQATVRLSRANGHLAVEIADDGRGFDPTAVSGSGLRGLADRIDALGGGMQVVSRPHEGTRLIATLPARERNGE